jgi:hypothetical protein
MTFISRASTDAPRAVWFGAVVLTGVLYTLGFACAAPFAGVAAIVALMGSRREALSLVAAAWVANQLVGFGVLHYPVEGETIFWGVALGLVALLSCEAARLAARMSGALRYGSAFLAGFVAYEGSLYALTLATGGATGHYEPASVARILAINAGAFVGLWAFHRVLSAIAARKPAAVLAA